MQIRLYLMSVGVKVGPSRLLWQDQSNVYGGAADG